MGAVISLVGHFQILWDATRLSRIDTANVDHLRLALYLITVLFGSLSGEKRISKMGRCAGERLRVLISHE